jgi:transposase
MFMIYGIKIVTWAIQKSVHDPYSMPRQMSNDERLRAIGMLQAGSSYRSVARCFSRSPNTIRSLYLKWRSLGSVAHASARLNRRHTTARADRRLIRTVRANPTMPATLLRLVWGERNRRGRILSAQTLRRRIKETALRCRRMRKLQRLSPAHVATRERWAMQRVHWRLQQWRRVIFTDESRFCLFRADGRIRVWREPRHGLLPKHIQIQERQSLNQHNCTNAHVGRHLLQWEDGVGVFGQQCDSQHLLRAPAEASDALRAARVRWPSQLYPPG